MDLTQFTPYLTALVMLLGILVGTLISPRIQQRVSTEHNRKDLIFQRKLKYFEGVIETIESNKRMYSNLMHRLEVSKKSSQINQIIEELKKSRKKFFISTSSLYFNIQIISEKIRRFVKIEKDIFNKLNLFKEADREAKKRIIEQLGNNLKNLDKRGIEILYEMRKELAR